MSEFWRGRRVLVTGHTGFKGAWLAAWLDLLGADVVGLALPPHTSPSLWSLIREAVRIEEVIGDIRDRDTIERAFGTGPEVVLHLAAQALVREGYREPAETFDVNVGGTLNVLEASLHTPATTTVLVITSDKVYSDKVYSDKVYSDKVYSDEVHDDEDPGVGPYRESSPLGGHDPYSASKACCELVVAAYRESRFGPEGRGLATARAGNVLGGGDWSVDRLVPDLVRSLDTGEPVPLRYPESTRPWQHVLDPLHGYLLMAEGLATEPGAVPPALNFGPDGAGSARVSEVADRFGTFFEHTPGWVRDEAVHPPEAAALELSSELAGKALDWSPRLALDATLGWTAEWYARHRCGEPAAELTVEQLRRFEGLAG